ncbi:hypothetical protein [Alicyclobacillus fastidiosus]|uniref:hypothetical protein n=1 Tax=Alicyclobacillus fastidiosus TaxID=392011 RepID=UPI0023E9A43A|nr:hypothetical protein [Alicyclobacillus fastidiosus]GMA65961.1 hypothetical protein GCM10025859_64030 [Alicyclobacillus fastidiosus]GMA66181.1 hypothetical protein GCM10025859_66230 [Alicyclobacillus fastidiosus]
MRRRTVSLKVDLYKLIHRRYSSMTAFADELRVTPACISQIVSGKSGSTRALRKKIAQKLETTPDRIWRGQ